MNVLNPYAQYQKNNTMSASPGELTLMLYDGCVKNIRVGREAILNKDPELANTSLQKAEAILDYLGNTLDMKYELSEQLFSLYEYWISELVKANMEKKPERLAPVIEMVLDLRDTWQEAVRSNRRVSLSQGALSQTGS